MTKESSIPAPSRPTPMATSERSQNKIVDCDHCDRTLRNTQENHSYCKTKSIKHDFFYFVLFSRTTPLPQLGLWTFEPAFSPRVSFPLSPRSIFQTSQRFLLLNHVTSGSMSLRSLFHTWSAVSPTGNDMTSSSGHVIALDQSEASIRTQMGPLYYFDV